MVALPSAQAAAIEAPPAAVGVAQERGHVNRWVQRAGVLRVLEGGRRRPWAVSCERKGPPGAAEEGPRATPQDASTGESSPAGYLGPAECGGTPRHGSDERMGFVAWLCGYVSWAAPCRIILYIVKAVVIYLYPRFLRYDG